MSTQTKHTKNVVIVGGGFAGVKSALELADDPHYSVTLISDKDHFLYYPALYATATGGSHLQSVVSLSQIFESKPSIKIIIDQVIGLDTQRRHITLASGKHHDYDVVVFALGVVTSYFGIKGLQEYSYSIKSYNEVLRFKRHLHDELVNEHKMDKNYIVVGAGPTGVELSAAMASYLTTIAQRHNVPHRKIRIDLVEAAPRVLPRMSERASQLVEKRLKALGVNVMVNHKVESEDDDSIIINGRDILSKTVVWTSGVSNHPFFKEHADIFKLAPNGRVIVNEQMEAAKDIYVIGDNANTAFTGLAQTALHDALFLARVLKARARRRDVPTYKAVRPPVVVPVGKDWAIFEWHRLRLTNWPAAWVRSMADAVGYHDILPLGHALGVWRAERLTEEDCPICAGKA